MTARVRVVDLFAGLGGFSAGAVMAGCAVVWAADHWREAVDIHEQNHPETQHACQDLQQANWMEVPAHDVILASPACQGHTPARGKERPHHDAQRSTAWAVVAAAECHRPEAFIVENVPEFAEWSLFPAWADALRILGYSLSLNVTDSADHGVPQHRRRLFVVGTRSAHPISLQLPRLEHVGADSFVDFDAGRWSLIDRPGRSAATLARIRSGRTRFGSRFLAPFYGSGSGQTGRCLSRPVGTITTKARWAVIDGDRMRMLSVEEVRRAMSFPDSYRLPANIAGANKMLGNAVPPIVARDFLRALQAAA